ncbi:hypothetical protein CRG98_039006 [Punica granatum]|uniref:Uncharacterized protein n=1 Tax=Punica granatum TaxID=22663 RepID=A0A2I0IB43_PUNGR|nr:hypothetical protein CRG98_039006 [Punica granatum]
MGLLGTRPENLLRGESIECGKRVVGAASGGRRGLRRILGGAVSKIDSGDVHHGLSDGSHVHGA